MNLGYGMMIGKQFSRWTMAWFATALAALITALGLAAIGLAGPGNWSGGAALAVVHIFVLGWLSQMMLGALIQFTPVLSNQPLALPRLALPALALCSIGTVALALGFLHLEGWEGAGLLLVTAPFVLSLGFALVGLMLVTTLIRAGALWQDETRMVALGLLALILLWASGTGMALALSGFAPLADFAAAGLPLHILTGVGGWLTLAATGVSYKLFSMFLLAPETGGRLRLTVFALGAVGLLLLVAQTFALSLGWFSPPLLIGLTAIAAAATALCYLAEIRRLWRLRRRTKTEPNMQWSRAALGFLALSVLLLLPALRWGGAWAEAAIFAALVGWLSTLTLAQMIKIVSFLTWIQVFAPLIGRRPTPQVHELTNGRLSHLGLALWTAGALCGTLALLAGSASGFRLAMGLLLIAALGLISEAIAIRRLRRLLADKRPDLLPPIILPARSRSIPHDQTRPAGA